MLKCSNAHTETVQANLVHPQLEDVSHQLEVVRDCADHHRQAAVRLWRELTAAGQKQREHKGFVPSRSASSSCSSAIATQSSTSGPSTNIQSQMR